MFQLSRYFLLLVFIMALGTGGEAIASPPSPTRNASSLANLHSPGELEISQSDSGVSLELSFPEPQITTNQDGTLSLEIPGYESLDQPGAARLPVTYRLVALPPGALPQLTIDQITLQQVPFTGVIEITPEQDEVVFDEEGQPVGIQRKPLDASLRNLPPDLPSTDTLAPVGFEILGIMRGVKLGRLAFYPVRPSAPGVLDVMSHVQVSLRYNVPVGVQSDAFIFSDPLVDRIAQIVINPDQVSAQANFSGDGSIPGLEPAVADLVSQIAIIPVSQPGITQLTYAALNGASFPVGSVNPLNLHLYHAGVEVAVEWDGNTDTVFQSNERLLFFADPRPSRWIDYDTYVLKEETTPGIRMIRQSSAPGVLTSANATVQRLEEKNLLYEPDDMIGMGSVDIGRDGDRYAWERLQWSNSGQVTKSYTFSVSSVDLSQPSSLKLWMIGYTDFVQNPDHRLDVKLNGTLLSTVIWDGKHAQEAVIDIPAGKLTNGSNTLALVLNGGISGVTVDGMWLDAFSTQFPLAIGNGLGSTSLLFSGASSQHKYTVALSATSGTLRAYDVTVAQRPLSLIDFTNVGNAITLGDPTVGGVHTYAVTSDTGLLTPLDSPGIRLQQALAQPSAGGASYIMISPAIFTSTLTPLVNLRSADYSVLVQDVQAIYDNYSDGRVDPLAIRTYLRDVYANWTTKPQIVLLVGDGTNNPRFYTSPNLRPVMNTYIPPFLSPVDPWLGETASDNQYVTLQGDDNLPEIVIGRLPVNSTAQLSVMVNKTIAYESTSSNVNWWKKFTIVSDDPEPGNNFTADAEAVAAQIPPPFSITKLYQTSPGVPFSNNDVVNAWSAGTHFMVYVGHASTLYWAKESDKIFRQNEDVPKIGTNTPTPILLALTCITGKFQLHHKPVMDEDILFLSGKGAVASWSPTGLGFSAGHVLLAEGFLDNAFNENFTRMGQATFSGILNLLAQNGPLDLVNTFVILGDPGLSLRVYVGQVSGKQVFIPLVNR